MELEFSNATKMLRQEVRRFVDEEFRPVLNGVSDEIERYHDLGPENPELTDNVRPHPIKIPDADRDRLREKAKKSGFWAMGVPEEYGGGGLNLVERCVVLEELSKHRMGLYQAGLGVIELGPGLTVGEPAAYRTRHASAASRLRSTERCGREAAAEPPLSGASPLPCRRAVAGDSRRSRRPNRSGTPYPNADRERPR
jgi:alkylation response protein AidB-like acyl-CoA dehydrogenase